jgi:hypothetical protein
MNKNIWAEKDCVWEDCDQEAVYCQGHALQYANVASEGEACKLRHQVDSLVGFLRYVAADTANPAAAKAAADKLVELGLTNHK